MTKKEREKLKKTAYHEAGHAVAAFAMKKRFMRVSIIPSPDGDTLGRLLGCDWRSKLNPEFDSGERLRHQVEAHITIFLAGPIAEAKLTNHYNHIGASRDYQNAASHADYVTGSPEETGAYLNWLIERTKNILSMEHWNAVGLLANELTKRQEIGYSTTRKIIIKAIDNYFAEMLKETQNF